jgi:hypothetical protein
MKYRKLRIAWSVACGIAVVLSVAMWVRTRYSIDGISGPLSRSTHFGVMSRHGGVGIAFFHGGQPTSWSVNSHPPDLEVPIDYETVFGFIEFQTLGNQTIWGFRLRVPYWSLVLLFITIAAIPWLCGRFSLRTLLIATTVVAIVLGLAVMLLRAS